MLNKSIDIEEDDKYGHETDLNKDQLAILLNDQEGIKASEQVIIQDDEDLEDQLDDIEISQPVMLSAFQPEQASLILCNQELKPIEGFLEIMWHQYKEDSSDASFPIPSINFTFSLDPSSAQTLSIDENKFPLNSRKLQIDLTKLDKIIATKTTYREETGFKKQATKLTFI